MSNHVQIELNVNGEFVSASIPVRRNLVDFLRNDLGLTGSHVGCEQGVCGACTVEVNGVMVRGCLMLAAQVEDANIYTVEGYGNKEFSNQALVEKLRQAFIKHNALQCGFCTPGMLASAIEYLREGGTTDRSAIREHLSGNYCRCTGYQAIVDAVEEVAGAES